MYFQQIDLKGMPFLQPLSFGTRIFLLAEALRYKLEGRGFDFRWCHWDFIFAITLRPHCIHGAESVSNGNEYQEYLLGVETAVAYG